jgi:acyl-CoA synthetase (AMP-forming)/AMP-acid ligase II
MDNKNTKSEIHINSQFWQPRLNELTANSDVKIIDADNNITLSVSQLEHKINEFSNQFSQHKKLIALVANNNIEFVISYLALLRAKHTILLLDGENSNAKNDEIIAQYQAHYCINNGVVSKKNERHLLLHHDLALLLSTSGSTGSEKFVKLSYKNLEANCHAICQYLPILPTDTVVTTLPLHYSFGLSILHSHLAVGATIVLTSASPLQSQLWALYKQYQPQSFYGVPFSFELLSKLNFKRLPLASVRYFAQAGGKLSSIAGNALIDLCQHSKQQLFVMYGQTEATARIAYLSPNKVAQKLGFIGKAIPNGELAILNKNNEIINEANTIGELCYRGDNVFIGYANTIEDLGISEEINWLHTGDLAECDEEGDYRITGRLKRIAKILGKRINLDEVENYLRSVTAIDFAISSTDEMLTLYYVSNSVSDSTLVGSDIDKLQQKISNFCHLNNRYVSLILRSTLPRKSNGKIDYMALNH